VKIAMAVANVVYGQGLTDAPRPLDLESHIRAQIFTPHYTSYV
jgi:hypothetical protein